MYVRYVWAAPLSLAFNIFVILTCPIWAAWAAIAKIEVLPWPFNMVHTHDNNIYGERMPATTPHRWLRAMRWLCRNPGYGFDAHVLGFRTTGEPTTWADTEGLDKGIFTILRTPDGSKRFSYRRDFYYRTGGNRYCKIWFGWKNNALAGWHICVFDINPFKRRK